MPPAFALSQDQTLRFISASTQPTPTSRTQHNPDPTRSTKRPDQTQITPEPRQPKHQANAKTNRPKPISVMPAKPSATSNHRQPTADRQTLKRTVTHRIDTSAANQDNQPIRSRRSTPNPNQPAIPSNQPRPRKPLSEQTKTEPIGRRQRIPSSICCCQRTKAESRTVPPARADAVSCFAEHQPGQTGRRGCRPTSLIHSPGTCKTAHPLGAPPM
jgi:hypothetical protein